MMHLSWLNKDLKHFNAKYPSLHNFCFLIEGSKYSHGFASWIFKVKKGHVFKPRSQLDGSTIQFLLAPLEENIFDSVQDVLICNFQPQNNEEAEQKKQKRQVNWTTCWTPASAYTQNSWKEPSIAPFCFIPSASLIGLFHYFSEL